MQQKRPAVASGTGASATIWGIGCLGACISQNIGRGAVTFRFHFSDIVRFDPWIKIRGSVVRFCRRPLSKLTT
jgi:hypothetical protein